MDMFYKYDNCADKKDYLNPVKPNFPDLLDNENPNAQIIKNAFGDEIGVKVNKNSTFSLFFNLFGNTDIYTMEDLITNNVVLFEIVHPKLGVIYSREVQDCFEDDCIKIDLNTDKIGLVYGNYTMKLTLKIKDDFDLSKESEIEESIKEESESALEIMGTEPEIDEEIKEEHYICYSLFSESDGLLVVM